MFRPLRFDGQASVLVESAGGLIFGGDVEGQSRQTGGAGVLFDRVHQGGGYAAAAKFLIDGQSQEVEIVIGNGR